ncbi:NFACT RNA binding domain-containing protein [Pleomorphovibrio marinus]|uniref:NFACT RNA binding domain-containing protein n=1 Tax=Pleomorphovibrio marinus TaxID=2164132 RepID=UPI000E0AEE39|nr:NFACT RNA binding domain-containing protein [Pleomorphovibrio marinus]
MHLNYHYFRFLCPALEPKLLKGRVTSCFSQNKDELVMEFEKYEGGAFHVVAHLVPASTCLYFPEDFKRSRKNNVDIFSELLGQTLSGIELLSFERAFTFQFDSGHVLLFKMHGSRSNLLLFKPGADTPHLLFRNALREDLNLRLEDLSRDLDLGYERFVTLEGNAAQFIPTLGKLPRAWLKNAGYLTADLPKRFQLIQEVLDMLESPLFSVYKGEEGYRLTLLPCGQSLFSSGDPIAAANTYYKYAVVRQSFETEKKQLLKLLNEQAKKTKAYIEKTYEKLEALETSNSPGQLADIIMANLHQIPQGAELVSLYDFYQDKEVEVKLKRDVSPAKFAENLYRKAKNRKKEVKQLEENLASKEAHLSLLLQDIELADGLEHFKELRGFVKERNLLPAKSSTQEVLPFKHFAVEGFDVLVGKSAKANDEMLRRYAWKEDLWLHAKDVSGSHVLVKHRSGLTFPSTVVEHAASLAAYYSKNRNETLCAVIYTPAKYVRKVKGTAPGAVMIDREKTLMVPPVGPSSE